MSGTLIISDQRSCIKMETLRVKNHMEIHGVLSEVCDEFTVDHSTVSRWANRFCGGCVSRVNDPRPGRPRTSTDERSVNLVSDAFEKDRLATCEELSKAMGAKKFLGKCTRRNLNCSWLGNSFSMTMFVRTSRML